MLDHLSLGVTDLQRAIRFYDAALAPLGYVRVWTDDAAAGYGGPGGEDRLSIQARADAAPAGPGAHVALTAPSATSVDAFHAAAVCNGGLDDGAPGPRPRYGLGYYAAFVRDPDGNKVEAVHHALLLAGDDHA
ncbi:MAG TPA: VOC family protein [Candidatus Tumulicola sp.]|nr:VOC family protein [Candidatus Tumulicola sp.]